MNQNEFIEEFKYAIQSLETRYFKRTIEDIKEEIIPKPNDLRLNALLNIE